MLRTSFARLTLQSRRDPWLAALRGDNVVESWRRGPAVALRAIGPERDPNAISGHGDRALAAGASAASECVQEGQKRSIPVLGGQSKSVNFREKRSISAPESRLINDLQAKESEKIVGRRSGPSGRSGRRRRPPDPRVPLGRRRRPMRRTGFRNKAHAASFAHVYKHRTRPPARQGIVATE